MPRLPLWWQVLGLLLSLLAYAQAKRLRQMLDTPTSLVRSAPVGHPELVGQVRPGAEGSMTVYVDGNETHGHVTTWSVFAGRTNKSKSVWSKTAKATRKGMRLGNGSFGPRWCAVHAS